MLPYRSKSFLRLLFTFRGSSSRGVGLRVLAFGAIAALVVVLDHYVVKVHLPVGVHETGAAIVALILAFRTNTGYNRFWEGRALWGTMVNASRNLARHASTHAQDDSDGEHELKKWIVVFAYVTRRRLRGQTSWPEVDRLLTADEARTLADAPHPSLYASSRISAIVTRWRREGRVDSILAVDAERFVAQLVDNLGGCERILKTPTPLGYVLLIERFIALYLATLPFMLVTRIEALTPIVAMMIAYPILLIDALARDLDEPFGQDPSDLPLTSICMTIEKDVLGTTPPRELAYSVEAEGAEL